MVQAYWNIGRIIVEEEQKGKTKADYGKQLIAELAKRLKADFGKGFNQSNLWHMRSFYLAFPILDAVRRELTWTHGRRNRGTSHIFNSYFFKTWMCPYLPIRKAIS